MTWYIRTDNSTLLAELPDTTAAHLIASASGEWENRPIKGDPRRIVFVFKQDIVFNTPHANFYIWSGYYLHKKVD